MRHGKLSISFWFSQTYRQFFVSALALESSSAFSNDPIIACMSREIANQTFVEAYMLNRVRRI